MPEKIIDHKKEFKIINGKNTLPFTPTKKIDNKYKTEGPIGQLPSTHLFCTVACP